MVIRGKMMILMILFQREKLLGMAELLFPTPGEEKEEKGEEEEGEVRRWSSRGGRGGSKESESEECESEESGIGETGSDGSSLGREEEGRGRSRRVCR